MRNRPDLPCAASPFQLLRLVNNATIQWIFRYIIRRQLRQIARKRAINRQAKGAQWRNGTGEFE
jgi:hypothetical protein